MMEALKPPSVPAFSSFLIPDLIRASSRTEWDFTHERFEVRFSYRGGDLKIFEVYDFFILQWLKQHLPPLSNGNWYCVHIHDGKAEQINI